MQPNQSDGDVLRVILCDARAPLAARISQFSATELKRELGHKGLVSLLASPFSRPLVQRLLFAATASLYNGVLTDRSGGVYVENINGEHDGIEGAASQKQTVIVIDFGAQYGQLIARRVRDLHVYSEIVPFDIDYDTLVAKQPSAIILSGGPASVYAPDAPKIDRRFLEMGVPVLGFCYGMQIMAQTLGGNVHQAIDSEDAGAGSDVVAVPASHDATDMGTIDMVDVGEYGPADFSRCLSAVESPLFAGTPDVQRVWMSHRDSVDRVPEGFVVTGSTSITPIAAMEDVSRKLYATQFHPEVHHTDCGTDILKNFLFDIAGFDACWTMGSIIDDTIAAVREQVGEKRVILGLSGGVDSSVVAALLARAIGKQLTCVFVNHGLLRKNEPEEVESVFSEQFDVDFVHVHAEERYAARLAGVTDPELKRKAIGEEFWKVFFEEAEKLDGAEFLAQGTIYPDVVESGSIKASKSASKIKSHHNLIPFPEGVHFELIEPLRRLFKDEVRELGVALGLPDFLVYRQPFPGPGLAIRIIGEVTPEKLAILRDADAIVRAELDMYNQRLFEETGDRNSERSVWQYFAVLPDIRSVGVMGDERTYARTIILRAVESLDAMTADWAKLPYDVLGRISSRIVGEVDGINRVVYDITPKPPATIEWE